MKRRLFAWLLVAICTSAAFGCGSGNSPQSSLAGLGPGSAIQAGQGRVTLTVIWPDRSRLIPFASNSIRANLTAGSTVVASQLLARPTTGNTSTAAFDNVSPGDLVLSATAYPNTDGTGIAQAKGNSPVTVSAGFTSTVSVTMGSTITQITLSPSNPTVEVGKIALLVATAKDAGGNVVLMSLQKLKWESSNTFRATVDSSGIVTGVAASSGITAPHIIVTDTESGKSATATVTVTGPIIVYDNDFESGTVDSAWSTVAVGTANPLHVEATPTNNRHFLGQLLQQKAILTLNSLPTHGHVTVSFDLFLIRTWDGDGGEPPGSTQWGPDIFQLQVANGPTLLNSSFSNWYGNLFPDSATQSYPNAFPAGINPAQTGAAEKNTLGYTFLTQFGDRDLDSVYHFSFTFIHNSSSVELDFNGLQNEFMNESWGLDNVQVSVSN